MDDYYKLILSVYARDTEYFLEFIEYEIAIALEHTNSKGLLRAIKTQLLLVYSIKVEGVNGTPSRIVDLLTEIDYYLNKEK